MAHKTLIDGTAYDISGGKALHAGTGYDIASGKTLVDGTGYDIAFSSGIPVKIVGGENRTTKPVLAYVEYNGTKYKNTTIYAAPEEKVRVYLRCVKGFSANLRFTVYGYVNSGTEISNREAEYYLTVYHSSTITFNVTSNYATATITYT